MELKTRAIVAKEVRDSFAPWRDSRLAPEESAMVDRLFALGDAPTPEAVKEIIGLRYTGLDWGCYECGAAVDYVELGGDDSDREAPHYRLCGACLLKASLLADASPAHVFADWLAEHGEQAAADKLRAAFPLRG